MSMSLNDIGVLANFLTPRGFEKIDLSGGGVQGLTPPDLGPTLILALIQAEGGDACYRDDTTDPTTAEGFLLFNKLGLQYNVGDLSLIKFIQADTATPAECINVLYYSFASVLEVPNPILPPVFCSVPSYAFAGPFPKTVTVVQTGLTNEVTVTAGAGGGSGGPLPTVASKSLTGNLSIETIFISNSDVNIGILGCGHNQLLVPGILTTGIGVVLLNAGNGRLFDFITATFIGDAFVVNYPFTISVNLDQAAATATFEFVDGVNDTSGIANVDSGYDNTQFTYLFGITTGIGVNAVVVLEMNAGNAPFTLANSNGTYCEYTNQVFCPYDDVSIFGATGISEIETGFIKVTGSLSERTIIETTPVSSTSAIAKSEILFVAEIDGASGEQLEISFVDADSATPNVFCGLIIDPIAQTVFDKVAAANVETGVVMAVSVYKIWVEFDLGAGTATYTDTLGNTGTLSVTGYTAGNNVFYSYRARAGTNATSSVTHGYNSGEKEFSNGLGTGKCAI